MDNDIRITPVHQTGHNCKITAIASIEKYYSKMLNFRAIPLHKRNKPTSIRQLAKKHGSVQGELLEIKQLTEILNDMGYEAQIVDCHSNFNLYKDTLVQSIKSNHFVLAAFAVDRRTGLPTTAYDGLNEHMAIINDIDEESGAIKMISWGREYVTNIRQFYASSMTLSPERKPEYYENVKNRGKERDRERKYDLTREQNDSVLGLPTTIKSITPAKDSGYRGKLIIIEKPRLEHILACRKHFYEPVSYSKMWRGKRKTSTAINGGRERSDYYAALKILGDYIKSNSSNPSSKFSSLKLFFAGHWNRHHTDSVKRLMKDLTHPCEGAQNIEHLLFRLNDILLEKGQPLNPDGSLARRINYIQKQSGQSIIDITALNDKINNLTTLSF